MDACDRLAIGFCVRGMFWKWACIVRAISTPESKAQVQQTRLAKFAAQIVDISAKLPKTPQGTHVSKQLLKSGTSAAANYAEARAAESRSDFIHKLRLVLKELNETAVWLQLIVENSWISAEKMTRIVAENEELCRMTAASIKTAGGFDRS